MTGYSDDDIEKLLAGIYDGSITPYDLPEDLYLSIGEYLKRAIFKGFGGGLADFEGKDLDLLTQLRENVYIFSAAKTYQQVKDISSKLVDEDGNVRSLKEFNDIGKETFELWNDTWGATEYTTAIAQAQSASKWSKIEKDKDALGMLEYSTVGDACDICAPLNGLTAPVDADVWDEVAPTNHYNCECILLQKETDEVTPTPDDERDSIIDKVSEKMDPVFKSNPGKTGEVFNGDHPYFDVPKDDRKYAENNFDLPIPKDDDE